ncbi:C40 family peptidase [Rhodococcus aerolatus]
MAPPSPARVLRRSLVAGLVAAGVALLPSVSPVASADPVVPATASEAEQQLAQISHQAEALNEQVLVAQEDLTAKRAAERTAQDQVGAAQASLDQAHATQAEFQGTVDSLASASYQGARVSSLSALMLSKSPQELLDQMSGLDVLAADTNARVAAYSAAEQQATQAQADAAAAARAASDAATAAQATEDQLAAKKGDLDAQAGQVRAKLASLTAEQRTSYLGTPVPAGFSAPAGSPAAATATAATSAAPAYTAPAGTGVGAAALQYALSKVGSPYSYGAAGPDSFDCSGLVMWAYAQAGVSVPRTSGGQAGAGSAVSQSDLQPGDIVIFYGGGHVGLYAGNGMVVHAPTEGDVVKVAPMQYMDYSGARRI